MVRVFAYGSNLCVERLRARVPDAAVLAVATLAGHALRWHKAGRDGSAKCDAVATGDDADVVWGVVYEVTPRGKAALDRFEGLGVEYFEKSVVVRARDGRPVDAVVYVANPARLDAAMRPYDWYRGFVVAGARQHGFPADYVAALEAVVFREDTDAARRAREFPVLESALRALD